MDRKLSADNEESRRRPVVISLKNAAFCHHFSEGRKPNDDIRSFILNPINGDIKKVSKSFNSRSNYGMLFKTKLRIETSNNFKMTLLEQGDLVCLEGTVGSGKTSFLNAINGNMSRISGQIQLLNMDDGMAYVSQQTWLQHGTMRENIIWGEIFDESRYRRTIWACALHKDIEDLGGDNIDIGENGSALSGGQKARVCLARAVYQDKQSEYQYFKSIISCRILRQFSHFFPLQFI